MIARSLVLACSLTVTLVLARAAHADVPPPEEKEEGGLRASFPLWSDEDPLEVAVHGSVIAQYVFGLRDGGEELAWFHSFELPRAQARVDVSLEDADARVTLEAVRSAAEGSLLGVAGDAFVFRVREAWAGYTAFEHVEARLGVVPTLTVGPLETMSGLRMVNPTLQERTGLLAPADLGGTLRGLLPGKFGFVGVGLYNGEGYSQRELNRGKNVEIGSAVHPLASIEGADPLVLQLSYVSGSSGTGLSRADRLTTGVAWEGDLLRGGATFTYGWGARGDGNTDSIAAEAFVRVHPIDPLVFGASASLWYRDVDVSTDHLTTITGTVGVYPVSIVGAFLAVDGFVMGEAARAALPAQEGVRFRLIGAADF